jgi:cytohesin
MAASNGYLEVVQLLLSAKEIDIDKMNHEYWTPLTALSAAASNSHARIVKVLLDAGANPNLGPSLAYAIEASNMEVTRMLLAAPGLDLKAPVGGTPLVYLAVQEGLTEALQALIDAGADPDEPTESDETPLLLACEHCSVEKVKILLDTGRVDIYHRMQKFGETWTPMRHALSKARSSLGGEEIAKMMKARQAELRRNKRNQSHT